MAKMLTQENPLLILLPSKIELDDVHAQNIEELLQITASESVSNEDLQELEKQMSVDEEISNSDLKNSYFM